MAAFRPEIFTIDEVLNFYDTAEGNDYKVYAGVNPSPQYLRYNFSGDKEIGRSGSCKWYGCGWWYQINPIIRRS